MKCTCPEGVNDWRDPRLCDRCARIAVTAEAAGRRTKREPAHHPAAPESNGRGQT